MNDKLYKFAKVVEAGSFTGASELLHISQPALSVAISKLEREVGAQLLLRDNKRLRLTPAGEIAYQTALEINRSESILRHKIQNLSHKRPIISIGMIDSIAAKICSGQNFDELEARADVNIIVNNSRILSDMASKGELDAAFVVNDRKPKDDIVTTAVMDELLVAVCKPNLRAFVEKQLGKGRIDRLISYDKSSTTHQLITELLLSNNISYKVRLHSTSPDVILDMVLQGKGMAVLPKQMVEKHINDKTLVYPVHNKDKLIVTRPIIRIEQKDKPHHEVLSKFLRTFTYCMDTN